MRHSNKQGLESRSWLSLSLILPVIAWCGLTLFLVSFVFRYVDLKPRVDENFFFSSHDPQLQDDQSISKIFLQEPQVILGARGDIRSPDYLRKLHELTGELLAVPGIDTAQSLTHGPRKPEDAPKSPLWGRVLFSKDQQASFIYVFIKQNASVEDVVLRIESLKRRFDAPDFKLIISGIPYIVELIRRNLLRDLKVFSVAAFFIFGLSGLLISRSVPMVLGTLIACTNASAFTLILTHAFGIPVGPLTANLSTIVFVLTFTHMVFMTFNWKYIVQKEETSIEKASWQAVRVTLHPSFWSMFATLLGFLSLLSVPAAPLRQLGLSGAMGTVIAFTAAYAIYPFFLQIQTPKLRKEKNAAESAGRHPFFKSRHSWIVAAILVVTALASIGLWKLDTEPSLFSYFKEGSELRNSLEYIDQNGGSSLLKIVLANPKKTPLKIEETYPQLWRLHETLEDDPSVGSVVSLPLFLAEAKHSLLLSFMPIHWVLKLLESPILGKTAKYYITEDRTKTLFLLRMKETYRQSDHLSNVERLKRIIRGQGFEPVLVGGTYLLYGKLSKLVASSLFEGVVLLVLLFMPIGGIISRSFRVMVAMFISLGVIPLLMLGILGHFRVPIDIISAPGANVAIGMGVDAMFHMLIWVRRHPAGSMRSWEAWASVCSRLWRPILYSMTVVSTGFGIFILSSFPPTQRFGFSIALGMLLSPLPALFLLPWFATAKIPKDLGQARGH